MLGDRLHVHRAELPLGAGQQSMVASAGEAEWVRNVHVAGGLAVLMRSGRRRAVSLHGLPVADRAEVLQACLWRDGRRPGNTKIAREADVYFRLSGETGPDQLRALASRYPVFRVQNRRPRSTTEGDGT